MSKPRNQLPINTKIPTSSSSPQKNHPSQRKSYNCFNTKDLAAFHPNNSDKEIPRKSSSWSTRRRMRRRRRRNRSICGRNVIISSPENHRPRTKSPDKHQCPPLDSDYETCSSDSEYASNLPEYGSEHMPGSGSGSGSSIFDAMLSTACACSSASSTKCKATNDNKAGRRQLPDGLGRTGGRKSNGNCFAVVKLSRDPRGEFMQSMVEMIVENDIRGSKDLEELLVCYLSLNSQEYHNLIISVFKQIWFDLVIHLRRSRHM